MLEGRTPAYFLAALVLREDGSKVKIGELFIFPCREGGERGASYASSWELANLTGSQKVSLSMRVMHHFLRVVGCDVGYNSLLMFRRLFSHYKMKSWWTENLDLAIVLADITVQTNQPEYAVYLHLAREVGEALGSCNQHATSVEVFEQVWAEYGSKSSDKMFANDMRMGLAEVYARNQQFDEAEETLFHGLRGALLAHGNQFFFGANACHIGQLANVYHDRNTVESNKNATTADMCLILMAISNVLGIGLGEPVPPELLNFVAVEYRKPKAARKAIVKALQKNSVMAFRAEVCSWKAKGAKHNAFLSEKSAPSSNTFRKFAKSQARVRARENMPIVQTMCRNPNCHDRVAEVEKMSRCSG
jgi:hypothetical protein